MELQLRRWQDGDEPALSAIMNGMDRRFLSDRLPDPYTEQDAAWWLHRVQQQEQNLYRAITVDGVCVGSVTVTVGEDIYRRSGELGYFLGEPFWGKGIMTWAAREICREAFEKLDIVRIHAEPMAYNIGSRRVLEKAGFTLEGTLRQSVYKRGQMFDSYIYSLLKEEMRP